MGGVLGGIGRAVFDPLNVTGAFDSGSSGPKRSPQPQPQPPGLYLPNAGTDFGYKPMSHQEVYEPQSGFGHGYKRFQHQSTADAPFAAQWQYGDSGPQWVEPVRESSSSWGSQTTTGPAKGNRI
jgi:hypothetical protein